MVGVRTPTHTTRTSLPYFSPNRAIAPSFSASSRGRTVHATGRSSAIFADELFDLGKLLGRRGLRIREVEPQIIGSDVAALLGDRFAEHLLECHWSTCVAV